MFFEFSSVVLELRENKTQFDKDEKEWMSNNENVYVLSKKNTNRFTSFGLGMEDRYFWSNLAMSWYYNKKFMMFIPSELFHNLYETNTLISSKNQIKLVGLKNRLDTLKIYATSKKEFFIYKLPTNVSEKISSSILVNYISSAQTEINKFGIKSSIKNKLLNNANISTEQQSCYVLPTKIGDFLVFKSPLNIPFQSINKIQILSKNPDKFPVFEF